VQILDSLSIPVGMFPQFVFEETKCQVAVDSTLYLLSDGIYEIPQDNQTIWGFTAFQNLLITQHKQRKFDLDSILQTVKKITNTNYFDDDVSILQIHFSQVLSNKQ
jgi:sigma-B regulation protein RsbU (phosphoserine phosphatase)